MLSRSPGDVGGKHDLPRQLRHCTNFCTFLQFLYGTIADMWGDFWMTANAMTALVFLPLSWIFAIFSFFTMILYGWWEMFLIAAALLLFFNLFQLWIEAMLA